MNEITEPRSAGVMAAYLLLAAAPAIQGFTVTMEALIPEMVWLPLGTVTALAADWVAAPVEVALYHWVTYEPAGSAKPTS